MIMRIYLLKNITRKPCIKICRALYKQSEVTFLNNLHRDSAAEIIYFILSNQNFETKSYIINCVNSVNAVPGERLISTRN